MGYSPRTAVLLLYGICVAFGAIALLLLIPSREITALVVIFLFFVIYASIRIFTGMTFPKLMTRLAEDAARNQQKRLIKLTAQRCITGIKSSQSLDAAWSHFCLLLSVIGFSRAKLNLDAQGTGKPICYDWNESHIANTGNPAYSLLDHSVTYLTIRRNDCHIGSIELYTEASLISQTWLPDTADMLDQIRTAIENKIILICSSEGDEDVKTNG
jgi:hypothetical protein